MTGTVSPMRARVALCMALPYAIALAAMALAG